MGFFTKSKEEYELMKKMCDTMEGSQKNNELMLKSLSQIIENQNPQEVAGLGEFESEEQLKFEKLRAAYALNLCTVSVSQIVDYCDVQILEQEYETILNNLNLEHMPKDEALLNILRQLLDTITFFRIQEGDKKFIEKEYQQKMKNAIWSAVPNFGLIVAGGNPVTMAISIASQVGIGYMNYRKTKAENNLEKEKQEWKLQRTAMEQFNGLRRELFDTSWRLADRYEFPDEYRLTERQIEQYNAILMERDVLRKYDRLDAIKNCFVAYPPFWYYYGHAANEIAQSALLDEDFEIYEEYRKLALDHFRYYMKVNTYSLLREDHIACSCALECVELLDVNENKIEMIELIEMAQRLSGRECDILQLCAIAYLRIGEREKAIPLLKYLVNERYNDVMNAQLLSSILVSGIIYEKIEKYDVEYKLLCKKIPSQLLFPMPKENETIEQLKDAFVANQQEDLCRKYGYVLKNYYDMCSVRFNKAIPRPFAGKQYSDEFYSMHHYEERLNQYKAVFKDKSTMQDFLFRLNDSNFTLVYLDVLNDMVNNIANILPFSGYEKTDIIQKLIAPIEKEIINNRELLNEQQVALNGNSPVGAMEKILKVSFDVFTKDFLANLLGVITMHVKQVSQMEDFAKEESMLRDFCIDNNIPVFKINYNNGNQNEQYDEPKVYFTSDMMGGEAFEKSEVIGRTRRMSKIIDEMERALFLDDKSQKVKIYTRWNRMTNGDFESYFTKGRKKYFTSNKDVRMTIFAVIVDDSINIGQSDLIFTIDGVFMDKTMTGFSENPAVTPYNDVEYRNGKLYMGKDKKEKYSHKDINMNQLYDLIQKLSSIASEYDNNQSYYMKLEQSTPLMIE